MGMGSGCGILQCLGPPPHRQGNSSRMLFPHPLAVKRNQPTLHAAMRAAFEDAERGAFAPAVRDRCETRKRNGGHRERRTCTVPVGPGLDEWVADPAEWPGLHSLIRVQTERNGPRGRQRAVRHCIASLPADAAAWSWSAATGT